jgi:hypothetical protein
VETGQLRQLLCFEPVDAAGGTAKYWAVAGASAAQRLSNHRLHPLALPALLGPIAELAGGFPLVHQLRPLLIRAAKFPAQRKEGRGLDQRARESPHWGVSKCKPQSGKGRGAWKLPGNQRASSVQLRQAR